MIASLHTLLKSGSRFVGSSNPARPFPLVRRLATSQDLKNKKTCLYEFHRSRNARLEPFAGYHMPIVYKSQSIKLEHMQTRGSASAFDVSHMMQTNIRGKDRVQFMESITVADIQGMPLNKCSLSLFTNDEGGIIDDCVLGKWDDHLQLAGLDVKLERLDGQGLIALQGPKAAEVLQKMSSLQLDKLKFMGTAEAELDQIGKCVVTRCGYTGEDGFEISVNPDVAIDLMEALCKDELVKPAGLGARDTLRLEAGLCLHGHDIDDKTTPVEAALSWVIHKRRREGSSFVGAEKILQQLKQGSKIKRIGLVAKNEGGPPAREGCEVLGRAGTKLGKITSGNFSPVLNRNIAMAYLPTDVLSQEGKMVFCHVRGKEIEYQITRMPFVRVNYFN